MAKNLIYISKGKLIGIDGILPVLMEIKALYPEIKIVIFFRNKKHLNLVRKNYNIWEAIESLNSQIYTMRGNKFITLIKVVLFIMKYTFAENIILRDADIFPLHNIVMRILRKTTQIKVYTMMLPKEGHRNLRLRRIMFTERGASSGKPKFFDGKYDYYISTINYQQFEEFYDAIAPPGDKMIHAGYVYKLPQWQKFIKEAVRRNKVINSGTYFLFLLTCLDRGITCFDQPEIIVLLEESLNVLKKYNAKIKTIFKPHIITDVEKFERLLKKINYSNYVIDYGHPMLLSSKARFVFANHFSRVSVDSYYSGIPVVEYSCYDPEFFRRIGEKSFGGGCCDFFIRRDQKKLDEVLNKLINGDVKVTRGPKFIQENFPDPTKEFYDFWHKLFASKKGA